MGTISQLLEWVAFTLSMICVFSYGKSKLIGSIVGIITAFTFIVWGIFAEVWAALLTNLVFIILHSRNLRIAIIENTESI